MIFYYAVDAFFAFLKVTFFTNVALSFNFYFFITQ